MPSLRKLETDDDTRSASLSEVPLNYHESGYNIQTRGCVSI